jgi:hypothetical protein
MQTISVTPFTLFEEKRVQEVKVCSLDKLDPLCRSSVKFEIKRIDSIISQTVISEFNRKLIAKTG